MKEPKISYGLTLKLNGRWAWSIIFSRFPISGCRIESDLDFETEGEADKDRKKMIKLLKRALK